MGKRDIGKRETKKPKKDAKKKMGTMIPLDQPVTVEVIKRGKKAKEDWDE